MKWVRTKNGSFCGVSNINLNIITGEDRIVITSILQSYVLHWYHTYIVHPWMDRTEAIILQHFHCPGTRKSVCKEVTNRDTCQCKKWSNKNGKRTGKEAE